MGGSPSMPGPSEAEQNLKSQQALLLQKQNEQADADKAELAKKKQDRIEALSSNRVGLSSLLSDGFKGYSRTGDLGAV